MSSQPIAVQINAHVTAPDNGRELSVTVIREAIERKARTGRDVRGIILSIVRWRHGKRWHHAANSKDEWISFGRFLPSSEITITRQTIRSH